MLTLDYRKGRPCLYNEITCQEGFCSGCEIYLRTSLSVSLKSPGHVHIQIEKNLKQFVESIAHEKVTVS